MVCTREHLAAAEAQSSRGRSKGFFLSIKLRELQSSADPSS